MIWRIGYTPSGFAYYIFSYKLFQSYFILPSAERSSSYIEKSTYILESIWSVILSVGEFLVR